MKRILKLFLSATLSLALASPFACALTPEERKEDLDTLYNSLAQLHPNIYYTNTQPVFEDFKHHIESQIDTMTDTEFILALTEFTARIGDSHTTLGFTILADRFHIYPFGTKVYDNRWTLATLPAQDQAYLGTYVERIAGYTPDEIMQAMSRLVVNDNPVKLSLTTRQMMSYYEILEYLGIANDMEPILIEVVDSDGKQNSFTLSPLPAQELSSAQLVSMASLQSSQPETAVQPGTYYTAFPLDASTFYIQYNVCYENPDMPMAAFAAAVEEQLTQASYRQILLDLRYNSGGSDGVLIPLLDIFADYARQNDCQLVGLIEEATYSSAIINAVMILEAGGTLAGYTAGGNVNHYGDLNVFTLPNSQADVYYSTKLISLADYFTAVATSRFVPLVPSILVPQTLEDYFAGRDTLIDYLTENPVQFQAPDRLLKLSRGPALEMLYKLSGAQASSSASAVFHDVVYDFASYTPAIAWAAETGIAAGTAENEFSPLRPISREEFAVFVHRYVQTLHPDVVVPSIYRILEDEHRISPWASEAVQICLTAGWMDAPDGVFSPQETLTYGEALDTISQLHRLPS